MRISLSLRALAVLAAGALLVAPAAAQPYGAHSMLSVTSPPAVKDAMFRSAARLHLTTIRVDVELQGIVLTDVWRDWHGLDEYVALSHRYRVRLLPVLMGRVPLWVTEHGYPGDSAYQCDPRFRGGEAAQAAYLRRLLPTLKSAGAARVFVTLRDNLAGAWASEGLLGGPPCAPRYKPAAWAVAGLTRSAV